MPPFNSRTIMKKTAYIFLLLSVLSCGTIKHQPQIIYRDSVRVEVRNRIIRDTVTYELPVIIEKHVTDDTLSVIENDYARTAAVVHDGRLSHDLQIKPYRFEVPVYIEVADTSRVEKSVVTETKIVEVEKELTAWQKFRLKAFWYLAGVVGLWIVWKSRKLWLHL